MGNEWHDETPEVDVTIFSMRTLKDNLISANLKKEKPHLAQVSISWPRACIQPLGLKLSLQ